MSEHKSEEERKNSFLHSAINKSGMNNKDGYIINNTEIKKPDIEFVDMD